MAIFAVAVASEANAQVSIVAIYGGGNPDGGWTSSSTANNLQLALRGKLRDSGSVPWSPGNIYNFPGGPSLLNSARSSVNWEFSINSDVSGSGLTNLLAFNYRISVDTDPTAGLSWTVFNPLTTYSDNSLGTNATTNGSGLEDNIYAGRNIAQNSENMAFLPFAAGAGITGIYDFRLQAFSLTDTDFVSPIAEVQVRLNIGVPSTTAVPEPSTYGLIGAAALIGLIATRRIRGKSSKA